MRKFCFICGEEEKKEGMCEKCFSERNMLAVIPQKLEATKCSKCGKIKIGNSWKEFDNKKFIESASKFREKIDKMEIKPLREEKKALIFRVILQGKIKDIQKKEEHDIKIHFTRVTCQACGRILGGYYESIIQLRGVSESIVNYIARQFKVEKDNPNAFFRIEENDKGYDIYAGDKYLAQAIVNRINKKFDVSIKSSFVARGLKNGKRITRTIYCIFFHQHGNINFS